MSSTFIPFWRRGASVQKIVQIYYTDLGQVTKVKSQYPLNPYVPGYWFRAHISQRSLVRLTQEKLRKTVTLKTEKTRKMPIGSETKGMQGQIPDQPDLTWMYNNGLVQL